MKIRQAAVWHLQKYTERREGREIFTKLSNVVQTAQIFLFFSFSFSSFFISLRYAERRKSFSAPAATVRWYNPKKVDCFDKIGALYRRKRPCDGVMKIEQGACECMCECECMFGKEYKVSQKHCHSFLHMPQSKPLTIYMSPVIKYYRLWEMFKLWKNNREKEMCLNLNLLMYGISKPYVNILDI